MSLILLAVGGNALIGTGRIDSAEEQFENARRTAELIARLLSGGHRLVLTHGNGPQVGATLARSELSAGEVYRMPYDCCVASTQGEIGYVLQHELWSALGAAGLQTPVAALLTQVVVDPEDPGAQRATKPIGPPYEKVVAERYRDDFGWTVSEVRPGVYHRVVPSPRPLRIVELEAIRACVDRGVLVIAAGGGGIPVRERGDDRRGVEAVIDKDLTSALLAVELDASLLAIATGVENVYLDYGRPRQRPIHRLSAAEGRRRLDGGEFPEGSMRPKIEAALRFVEATGREAVITDLPSMPDAVARHAGTRIHP
jgi:carbamate kinase